MKKIPAFFVILLLVSYACKDSVYEPYNNNFSDFFPNSDGNYYYYNVSVIDTNGTTTQSGTRKTYYAGDTIIFTIPHQIKVDSFQLTSIQTITNNYFRKNSNGVFNSVGIDSNGFLYLMPDSLRGGYSFITEYRMLDNPPELNQNWQVFKVDIDLLYIGFEFLNVDAEVESMDTLRVSFQNTTRTTEVFNIRYNASLTTGLYQPPVLFEVNAWFAKGIGPVKWEGDSELMNFFAGAEIYPMNTTVLEELLTFKLN